MTRQGTTNVVRLPKDICLVSGMAGMAGWEATEIE